MKIAKGAKFVPMTPEQIDEAADRARERRRWGGEQTFVHQIATTHSLPGTHERSRRQNNRFRPRRTLKGDFSMRIRKHLLVGGATAAVALASVVAAVAGAQAIRGTVQADGSSTVAPFSRRQAPNCASASTAAPASSSASPARAAASSASARTRPTCPTPRGRSGRPRLPSATRRGSATSSSWWRTTASRSRSTDRTLG